MEKVDALQFPKMVRLPVVSTAGEHTPSPTRDTWHAATQNTRQTATCGHSDPKREGPGHPIWVWFELSFNLSRIWEGAKDPA